MVDGKKVKVTGEDPEEIKEVLKIVSEEIPGLIKGIIGSVFSEEAGRNMGRAASAFYKELKESGMPDEIAVRMTENYIGVFTNLGGLMKQFSQGSIGKGDIEAKIRKKLAEKGLSEDECGE